MSISPSKGIAAALLVAGLALGTGSMARSEQPAAQPAAAGAIPAGKADGATDNALRRNPAPTGLAVRGADRLYCREQAAKRKLFGLGRHKFLQRCRKARRKAHPQQGPSR